MPQIEGLTNGDLLQYAKKMPKMLQHLPEEADWGLLDRRWIADLLYSLYPEGTQKLVDAAMSARKAKLEKKQNLLVDMRPEFVKALEQSMSFSSKHCILQLACSYERPLRTPDEVFDQAQEDEQGDEEVRSHGGGGEGEPGVAVKLQEAARRAAAGEGCEDQRPSGLQGPDAATFGPRSHRQARRSHRQAAGPQRRGQRGEGVSEYWLT